MVYWITNGVLYYAKGRPNKRYTPEFKTLVVVIWWLSIMAPNDDRKFLSSSRFTDKYRSSVVTIWEELYKEDANHSMQHAWMRTRRGPFGKNNRKRLGCRPIKNSKKLEKSREILDFTAFLGGPDRIRTDDPHNANQHPKLFSSISGHFWPFPLRSTSSLGLFDHAVSVWSGTVCGRLCGQKRSPVLADVFRRQGRGAFFMPLTACIVTLRAG